MSIDDTRTTWTADEGDAVRAALVDVQDRLPVGAAPWEALRRRRRRARARRFATVVGAAAAASGVFALATGAVSGHSGTAAVAGPSSAPVGSLAQDPTFLADLRATALAQRRSATGGASSGAGVGLRVVLATDVPGGRIALVDWTDGHGRVDGAQWLTGPEGSPARQMRMSSSCDLALPCWTRYGDGFSYVDDRRPDGTVVREQRRGEGVVVASPPGSRVTVRGVNDVTAAGSARRLAVSATERWRGVFVAPLPTAAGRLDVEVTGSGSTWRDWSYAGSPQDSDLWWVNASTAARGTPVTDLVARADLVTAAERAAAMPATDASRVLWQMAAASSDRAVIALRGESGGWAVAAVHRTRTSGSTVTEAVDALTLLPAGDPADACLAWREGPAAEATLHLVGPAAAGRAELSGGGVPQVSIALAQGVGSASGAVASTATGVRFLDAFGNGVGQCGVVAPLRDGQTLR